MEPMEFQVTEETRRLSAHLQYLIDSLASIGNGAEHLNAQRYLRQAIATVSEQLAEAMAPGYRGPPPGRARYGGPNSSDSEDLEGVVRVD